MVLNESEIVRQAVAYKLDLDCYQEPDTGDESKNHEYMSEVFTENDCDRSVWSHYETMTSDFLTRADLADLAQVSGSNGSPESEIGYMLAATPYGASFADRTEDSAVGDRLDEVLSSVTNHDVNLFSYTVEPGVVKVGLE